MDLRNWEFYTSGNAVAGADVYVYEASLAHPNPNSPLSSTTTNSDGMWAFTGLSDTAKDVKVVYQSKAKWYKGLTRHSVGVIFVDDYPTSDFSQMLGQASVAAPAAGLGRLYFKTDGRLYAQYASGGEKPVGWTAVAKISRALGSTASPTITSASGNATIPEMSITVDVPAGADVVASLALNQTYNVPAGGMACSFWIDESVSGAVSPTYNTRHFTSGTDGGQAISITHLFPAMAGGTYTFRGRWAVPAGTQTLTGTSRELVVAVNKQ